MSVRNVSGMVSDISIEYGDDVAVFLLLPKAYIKHLDKSFIDVPIHIECGYPRVSAWGYYDDRNTMHGDYVPFHLPLFGWFNEYGNVCLVSTPEIKWLEEFLGFNDEQFFDHNVIEREQVELSDDTVINKDNIFQYLSVAYEHAGFYKEIVENAPDKGKVVNNRYRGRGLKENNSFNEYLTFGYFTGENVSPYIKDPVAVLSGRTEYTALKSLVDIYSKKFEMPTIDFNMFVRFMVQVNKNFHLSGMSIQRCGSDAYQLLAKAQSNVFKSIESKHDEE